MTISSLEPVSNTEEDIFRLPLEMSRHGTKQGLKNDFDGSNILRVVDSIRNEMYDRSMYFIGRVLVGVVRIFSLRVDSFELKIQAVMNHIDKVLSYDSAVPRERKPRRLPNSAQRKALRNAVTLPTVPETNAILAINLDDVIFENTTIPQQLPLPPIMSSTPGGGSDSGRKRRLSTAATSTPSRRRFPSSPFDNILMTPDGGFSLDSDADEDNRKRTRRMSSISEVMDSLREDDGSRRLSGLMGSRQPRDSILTTAGNSAAQSPENFFDVPEPADWEDHDDPPAAFLQTPLQPVSLLQLTTGQAPPRVPARTGRKSLATIKSLMDRKGKRGIEIDVTVLSKRRNQLLNFNKNRPLYIPNPTHRIVFPVREFYRDFSSHIRWYVPPPPGVQLPKRTPRVSQITTRPSPDEIFDAPENDDTPLDPPTEPPLLNPGNNNSFLDKIARSKSPVVMSTALSRTQIVADFVKSLHYTSEGVLEIVKSDNKMMINLNSISTTKITRGPRWESFIMS